MSTRHLLAAAALAVTAITGAAAWQPAAAEGNAICYNCPPEWADWASQLKAIKENTGISVPHPGRQGRRRAALQAGRLR